MSKGKKAVIALLTFVIATVGIGYGLFIYTSQMPSEAELLLKEQAESKDFKKYKVYENDTPFYVALDQTTNRNKDNTGGYVFAYDFIKPVMENVNSSYIWTNFYDNISYGVSKESLIEKIEEYDNDKMNDLDTAIRTCKFLITNMTGHAPEANYPALNGKKPIYWSYSRLIDEATWRTLSAFEKAVSPEEFEDQSTSYMKDNVLLLKGLDLDIENPVVEKVMCVDWCLDWQMYNMMISADVTTKKKPADFDKCSWIPDEGETKRVTFVIMTTSIKRLNTHFVSDVAVVGYN